MRLLVSVRSAPEALAAVAGGADVVDAKEPALGPLGAVEPAVLEEIARALPAGMPLSIALGDYTAPEEAAEAVRSCSPALAALRAPGYVKLGFHGAARTEDVTAIVAAAVLAARPGGPGVIAAAYAEGAAVGAVDAFEVVEAAITGGAAGALLDTRTKRGRNLVHWMPAEKVGRWVVAVRGAGLLAAIAGSLDLEALPAVLRCGADIVGVRGAACVGGRAGRVDAARVAALKAAIVGLECGKPALVCHPERSEGGMP
jgi:(5-formylfuran-3-yl)methyl phosphate synthase